MVHPVHSADLVHFAHMLKHMYRSSIFLSGAMSLETNPGVSERLDHAMRELETAMSFQPALDSGTPGVEVNPLRAVDGALSTESSNVGIFLS